MSAMLGIANEDDDDGNEGSAENGQKKKIAAEKKPEAKREFTLVQLFRKCQDGLLLLRDEKHIDVDMFTKDMAELERVKDDYAALLLFYNATKNQYSAAKKASKGSEKKADIADEKKEGLF